MQSKCIETCPLLSLIHTTLYQCRTHSNAPVSTHSDSRYRDNDRYTLIVPIHIIRQTLDSTDISTSSKGKAPVSMNDVETYSKEILNDKIRKLIIINIQLITDKIETEKVKVNLKANKIRLFDKKNSLIAKREELRT